MKDPTICDISRVSQSGKCRRKATITRITANGMELHFCAKCDSWEVIPGRTAGDIIGKKVLA
jgi:hypothetical protein